MITVETLHDDSGPRQMDLGTSQLSYAAGSTSLDPLGFRLLDDSEPSRFGQLLETFPTLADWLSSESLIINAYPAALGIGGFAPMVDTYLHPPTFIRAMRLAAIDQRDVVLAAQPLVGADFLLKMADAGYEIPRQVVWASGGYYFPESLQHFMENHLAGHDCQLRVLHCYGAAEVGHTCFAAVERFESGHPRYRHVAKHIDANVAFNDETLVLSTNNRSINTGDYATCDTQDWNIQNSPSRLGADVREEIESWGPEQWQRRTGYSGTRGALRQWQRRNASPQEGDPSELSFHQFWEQHGGSFQTKPDWRSLSNVRVH